MEEEECSVLKDSFFLMGVLAGPLLRQLVARGVREQHIKGMSYLFIYLFIDGCDDLMEEYKRIVLLIPVSGMNRGKRNDKLEWQRKVDAFTPS